jgi:hypothetical protein
MRIAYFIKRPLSARDFKRYGIEYFLEKEHEIVVIDLNERRRRFARPFAVLRSNKF